jgi:hypothetical protein
MGGDASLWGRKVVQGAESLPDVVEREASVEAEVEASEQLEELVALRWEQPALASQGYEAVHVVDCCSNSAEGQ